MVPFYEFQNEEIKIILNHRELKYKAHIHDEIELIYVFEHGQHINIDGSDREIHAGEAAVIFPNIVHTYYRNEWRDTEQIFVIFPQKLFGALFPDMHGFCAEDPVIYEPDEITRLAFRELAKLPDNTERIAWITLIMSRIIKVLRFRAHETVPVEGLTHKIITYIAQHFAEDITLDRLSAELSVSKYYISRTFSDRIKISLPNYLALIRAEYAAGLIRTTNDSITNICLNSGFSSQTTFNRAFKRIYRMTPREYKDSIGSLYNIGTEK